MRWVPGRYRSGIGVDTMPADKLGQMWVSAVEDSTFHLLVIHLEGVELLWAVVEATQQHNMTSGFQLWWMALKAKIPMKALWIPLLQPHPNDFISPNFLHCSMLETLKRTSISSPCLDRGTNIEKLKKKTHKSSCHSGSKHFVES